MDWNADLANKPEAELTSVAYWKAENQEDGVFTFPFNSAVVNEEKTNIALINSGTSQKVVLWFVNHPSSKFPEAITPGEKFLRATLRVMEEETASPDEIVKFANFCEGLSFVFDSNQRVMKYQVTTA